MKDVLSDPQQQVQWEDPPSLGGNASKYAWFWAELRANPGKWARYPGSSKGLGTNIKGHRGFKGVTRRVPGSPDKVDAWVCYVGEDVTP